MDGRNEEIACAAATGKIIMYFNDICVEIGQASDGTRPWLAEGEIEFLYRKHGLLQESHEKNDTPGEC